MTDVTFRLVSLSPDHGSIKGETALTADLARLIPGGLANPEVRKHRLGIERTDWSSAAGGKELRPIRTVLIDAESEPGEWEIGPGPPRGER
jgi:hypothetical protein